MLLQIRIFLFSLFVTFSFSALSQVDDIDSLKIVLKQRTKRDTARVNTLYKLAFAHLPYGESAINPYLNEVEHLSDSLNFTLGKAKYSYLRGILQSIKSNYPESQKRFEESYDYYKSINDKKGMSAVHVAFGITHFELGEYEEAIEDYEMATELIKNTARPMDVIDAEINTANIYIKLGRYDEAVAKFKEAKKLSEKNNLASSVASANANLGVVYRYQGNYPLAIDYYNKALDYHKKVNDSLGIARGLSNLGDVYSSSEKLDKALEFNLKAIKYLGNGANRRMKSVIYMNIGNIYIDQKDFNRALKYFNKSLVISREINALEEISMNLHNIADIYLEIEQPIKARELFAEAMEISAEIGSKRLLSYNNLGIANTYFDVKQYKKALPFALEGKKYAVELDILETQSKAEELLYKIYQKTGRFKEALESHERFKVLNDSLFNEENIEKITQIEYEYKYKNQLEAAKFKEMALTETVNETTDNLEKSQRNLLYGIIIFLAVTVLLGGIIFFLRLRNVKEKTQNIITEQKLLRSQMTPHFIFNAMSVLQGIILNKEDAKAVSYLSKFSRLLRITLENSRDQLVSLKNELVAVENYIDLQNIEAKTPFVYSINIAENIDSEKVKIPPMLIQPFIENSIEHGFVNHEGDKIIEITISRKDNLLNCIITDNGVGVNTRKESVNRNKKSLSTAITTERIELLSKNTKNKGSISIEDRKKYGAQGTQVTMLIPYQVD